MISAMPRTFTRFGLIVGAFLVQVSGLHAQVPSPIPSDPAAQIFNLIQRVTALEQKVAALSQALNNKGTGAPATRVKAPFEVVDDAGRPIFSVVQFGKNTQMATSGMVITHEPTTGAAVLLAFNKKKSTVVALGADPDGQGQLTLRDAQGRTRAELAGAGKLLISDAKGKGLLSVSDDITQSTAHINIGKDEEGYTVEVMSGKGGGGASISATRKGLGEVGVTDEKGETRAYLGGAGELTILDAAGNNTLNVTEHPDDDSVGVTIGKSEKGYMISVGAGGNSVSMGSSGSVAGVATYLNGVPAGSLMLVDGTPRLELANDRGTSVTSLGVSPHGNGFIQVGNADGATVVDIGTVGKGVGLVRAYPVGSPGAGLIGMPGTFLVGRE
jgi:hypothetical protein